MSDEKKEELKKVDSNEINEEGDQILTLSDLLNEQRAIDEDAEAVLGGSDENHCTYSEGYIKRQALYACLTCVPESKENPEKRAGICLACSYKCHDGHDLVELYTKRNFRCDCGTSKILAIRCKLDANKMEDNAKNTYNQNFSGVYCICHRPYPDEQDDIQDEMIQCVFCEDWFHSRHLNAKIPDSNAFDEMICDSCTLKNDFLNYYSGYCIALSENDNTTINTSTELDITGTDPGSEIEKGNTTGTASSTSTSTSTGTSTSTSVNISGNSKANNNTNTDDKDNVNASTSTSTETSTKSVIETSKANNVTTKENESGEIEKKDTSLNEEINQCIQDIIEINKSNVQSENSIKKRSSTNNDIPPNKRVKLLIKW